MKIYDLMKMDKRTKAYKQALRAYEYEQAKLKADHDFLTAFYQLTKEEKRTIIESADRCLLLYLHNNAATVPALKPIKERLSMSWQLFNKFCLKVKQLVEV
jgi:hypothetical protein